MKRKFILVTIALFAALSLAYAGSEFTPMRVIGDKESDGYTLVGHGEFEGEFLPFCSWYCGGVVAKASASSSLDAPDARYLARCAHDFDIRTAWVEGAPGLGIGEILTYEFDCRGARAETTPGGLGICGLYVINGYRKSKALWRQNGRVSKLLMVVNGKTHAKFTLADTSEVQGADFPILMLPKGSYTKIEFKIMGAYRGTKYEDTAITEIAFYGIGVH